MTNDDLSIPDFLRRGVAAQRAVDAAIAAAPNAAPKATAPIGDGALKESSMRTATNRRAAARSRPSPKSPARRKITARVAERADGLRPGSKLARLIDKALAAGDEGSTEQSLAKALDWIRCAVTLRRVCERVGASCELVKQLDGKPSRFVVKMKPKRSR